MATFPRRLRALTVRYTEAATGTGDPVLAPPVLDSPEACAALFTTLLGGEACEVFGLLCVSSTRRLIAYHEVSRGSRSMPRWSTRVKSSRPRCLPTPRPFCLRTTIRAVIPLRVPMTMS